MKITYGEFLNLAIGRCYVSIPFDDSILIKCLNGDVVEGCVYSVKGSRDNLSAIIIESDMGRITIPVESIKSLEITRED